jgi:hypothetical protein
MSLISHLDPKNSYFSGKKRSHEARHVDFSYHEERHHHLARAKVVEMWKWFYRVHSLPALALIKKYNLF